MTEFQNTTQSSVLTSLEALFIFPLLIHPWTCYSLSSTIFSTQATFLPVRFCFQHYIVYLPKTPSLWFHHHKAWLHYSITISPFTYFHGPSPHVIYYCGHLIKISWFMGKSSSMSVVWNQHPECCFYPKLWEMCFSSFSDKCSQKILALNNCWETHRFHLVTGNECKRGLILTLRNYICGLALLLFAKL